MRVLVVDLNAGFAALIASELQRLGHEVVVCADGYCAYQAARTSLPDLALLDIGLQEPETLALARSLRLLNPELRLMLIAGSGEESVLQDASVTIQGVLPRPFFLPELPERIGVAMAAPVVEASAGEVPEPAGESVNRANIIPEDVTTAPTGVAGDHAPKEPTDLRSLSRRAFRLHQGVVESLMADLARDVGAVGVLLTSASGLLTAVGTLDEAEIDAVSRAVLQGRQSSAEMARILGREQVRFEQSTSGGSHLLYALSVHDAILALMVKGETQLGLLRHRARATGERIATLCVAGE